MPGVVRPAPAQLLTAQAVMSDCANPDRERPVEQEARRDADGMVRWLPTGLDDADRQAIAAVWTARELPDLAEVYRVHTEVVGRQWDGRVAEAGAARRRQIECVQRGLHKPRGTATVRCACGWTSALPA